MGRKLYCTLRSLISIFTPKMTTTWEVPFDGEPSVFCPNHVGALGPISMMAHFPLANDCRPWINAGIMYKDTVPAYVRQDYWWKPESKLAPLYNAVLPPLASHILPPILTGAESVPVYHDVNVIKTFRQSISYLKEKKHLIIFAQQPSGFGEHEKTLNRGFLLLSPMVYKKLGIALSYYPVHIDAKKHTFHVTAPIKYDPTIPLAEQEDKILQHISKGIFPDDPIQNNT